MLVVIGGGDPTIPAADHAAALPDAIEESHFRRRMSIVTYRAD